MSDHTPDDSYFTDAPDTAAQGETAPLNIPVTTSPDDHTVTGLAYRTVTAESGLAAYTLFADGAEVAGRWIVEAGHFTPAPV